MKRTPWNGRRTISEARDVDIAQIGKYKLGNIEFPRGEFLDTVIRRLQRVKGAGWADRDNNSIALNKVLYKLDKVQDAINCIAFESEYGRKPTNTADMKKVKISKRGTSKLVPNLKDEISLKINIPVGKDEKGKQIRREIPVGVIAVVNSFRDPKTIPDDEPDGTTIGVYIKSTVHSDDDISTSSELIRQAIVGTKEESSLLQEKLVKFLDEVRKTDKTLWVAPNAPGSVKGPIFVVGEVINVMKTLENMGESELFELREELFLKEYKIRRAMEEQRDNEVERLEQTTGESAELEKKLAVNLDEDPRSGGVLSHVYSLLSTARGGDPILLGAEGKSKSDWIAIGKIPSGHLVIYASGNPSLESQFKKMKFRAGEDVPDRDDFFTPILPLPSLSDIARPEADPTDETAQLNPRADHNKQVLRQWETMRKLYRRLKRTPEGSAIVSADVEDESQGDSETLEQITNVLTPDQIEALDKEGMLDERSVEQSFRDLLKNTGRYEQSDRAKDDLMNAKRRAWELYMIPHIKMPPDWPQAGGAGAKQHLPADQLDYDYAALPTDIKSRTNQKDIIKRQTKWLDDNQEWLTNTVNRLTPRYQDLRDKWEASMLVKLQKPVVATPESGLYTQALAEYQKAKENLAKMQVSGRILEADVELSDEQKAKIAKILDDAALKKSRPPKKPPVEAPTGPKISPDTTFIGPKGKEKGKASAWPRPIERPIEPVSSPYPGPIPRPETGEAARTEEDDYADIDEIARALGDDVEEN